VERETGFESATFSLWSLPLVGPGLSSHIPNASTKMSASAGAQDVMMSVAGAFDALRGGQ